MRGDTALRRLRRRHLFLLGVLLAVFAFAATASGNLQSSLFESGDGNLVVNAGGNKDWTNVGIDCVDDDPPAGDERQGCALDRPTGQNDDSFGTGADENEPNPSVVSGSIPNNKSDLTRFYIHSETNFDADDASDPPSQTGDRNEDFVYLAWERVQEPTGTTNMDFEFNKNYCDPATDDVDATDENACSSNDVTPARSQGDALIRYDLAQGGVNPQLGYHLWETQAGNPNAQSSTARAAICEAGNKFPCWGKKKGLGGAFEASINGGVVTDPIDPDAPRTLSARTFGEAAINLTDSGLLPEAGAGGCTSFGSAYLKSRSSDSFTAALKDFIAPIRVDISNCGTLELKKALVPSSDPGKFNLFIKKDGTTITGGSATEVGDGGTTGPKSVFAATYNVSETAGTGTSLDDYASSLACVDTSNNAAVDSTGGNVSVGINQDIVCTITNSRLPQLKLVKVLNPTGDSGKFDLMDGASVKVDEGGNNASSGFYNTTTGSHTISEVAGSTSPTALSDYDSKVVCDSSKGSADPGTSLAITLAYGDKVTCTFTNQRLPQLKLVKVLNPTGDSGKFDLSDSVEGLKVDDGGHNATSNFFNTTTGSHTVSEAGGTGTSLDDYDSKVVCDSSKGSTDPGTSLAITLAYGDVVTCTFTNNRKPQLKLVKVLNPTGDSGRFDLSDSVEGLKVDDGGHNATSGFFNTSIGSHTVSEAGGTSTSLDDYDSKVVCDSSKGSTDPGTSRAFSLAYGDQVTCTFTNQRKPQLKLVKDFVGGTTTVDLKLDGTTKKQVTADDDTGFFNTTTGAHTVSEAFPGADGADFDSKVSCDDADESSADPGTSVGIDLDYGDSVTCTFTNSRLPELKLVKDFVGGTTTVDLKLDGTTKKQVTADDDTGFFNTTAANHTVSETFPGGDGADFASEVACDSDKGSDADTDVSISLAYGHRVTCTFTNTKLARIIVTKLVEPADDPTEFDFDITGPSSFLDEATLGHLDQYDSLHRLTPGTYDITETVPDDWQMEATCSLNGGTSTAYTNGDDRTLAAGDTLSCVFTNFGPHKVIVIVCHENTDSLWPSPVENGEGTMDSVAAEDLEGTSLDETELCQLPGFGGKPHGEKTLTVDIAEHVDLQQYGGN